MPFQKGHKLSVGNSGGKSINNKKLAAKVRNLTLKEMRKVLVGDDNDFKRQLVLALARNILPKLNEHSGDQENKIPIPILHIVSPDIEKSEPQAS